MKKFRFFLLFLFFLSTLAYQAFSQAKFDIKNLIDWTDMELRAQTSLNLASVDIKLPGGRVSAEEIIDAEYLHIIRGILSAVPVDSSHTIGDFLRSGEINLNALDALSRPSRQTPSALSSDMAYLTASYTVPLKNISALLTRHTRAASVRSPLSAIKTTAYTGIVIIADTALPIHGRNTSSLVYPCLLPKIWDTDMNIIYEKSITEPSQPKNGIVKYVNEEAIFRSTPSGMNAELESLVGRNPLRVIARGVFGENPTDPIIDKDDALLILSSQANIRLLRESRVVIVISQDALKSSL